MYWCYLLWFILTDKSSNEDPLAEDTANKEEEETKTDDSPPEEAPPTEEGPAPISVEVTVEDNKGRVNK